MLTIARSRSYLLGRGGIGQRAWVDSRQSTKSRDKSSERNKWVRQGHLQAHQPGQPVHSNCQHRNSYLARFTLIRSATVCRSASPASYRNKILGEPAIRDHCSLAQSAGRLAPLLRDEIRDGRPVDGSRQCLSHLRVSGKRNPKEKNEGDRFVGMRDASRTPRSAAGRVSSAGISARSVLASSRSSN
jgi:hypothetical protein